MLCIILQFLCRRGIDCHGQTKLQRKRSGMGFPCFPCKAPRNLPAATICGRWTLNISPFSICRDRILKFESLLPSSSRPCNVRQIMIRLSRAMKRPSQSLFSIPHTRSYVVASQTTRAKEAPVRCLDYFIHMLRAALICPSKRTLGKQRGILSSIMSKHHHLG